MKGLDHELREIEEFELTDGRVFVKERRRKRRLWAPTGAARVAATRRSLISLAAWMVLGTAVVVLLAVLAPRLLDAINTEAIAHRQRLAHMDAQEEAQREQLATGEAISATLRDDDVIEVRKGGEVKKVQPGDKHYRVLRSYLGTQKSADIVVPGATQMPDGSWRLGGEKEGGARSTANGTSDR